MRRIRFLPFLAAIVLAFSLTSCGSDHDTSVGPTAESNALLGGLTGSLTEQPNDDLSDPPGETTSDLQSMLRGLTGGVLACPSSQTYNASAVIGPEGGTIQIGPHQLVIPQNALATPTPITATAPAGNVTTITFTPHGLTFVRPTWLTMSYAHCPTILRATKRIVYVDGDLNILEILPSANDLRNKKVRGKLDHFSAYAVAE